MSNLELYVNPNFDIYICMSETVPAVAVTEVEKKCFKCGAPGIRALSGMQHEVCAEHLYASVKVVDFACDLCGSAPCSCCQKCGGTGNVVVAQWADGAGGTDEDTDYCDLCGGCGVWP